MIFVARPISARPGSSQSLSRSRPFERREDLGDEVVLNAEPQGIPTGTPGEEDRCIETRS